MNEQRRRLVQGVILGSFMGAGVVFVAFWRIIRSAENAGSMVAGQFHPYQSDPTWHILIAGGIIMIASALTMLAITWRSIGAPNS